MFWREAGERYASTLPLLQMWQGGTYTSKLLLWQRDESKDLIEKKRGAIGRH